MEFTISSEEKIKSLNAVITQNEINLYQALITAGYDPDSFDEDSYVVPEEAYPMSVFHTIETLLEKIATLKAMLADI
jgi:hypothetical protein